MLRQFLFGLLILSSPLTAQVPLPRQMTPSEGSMTISIQTAIIRPKTLENEANILFGYLGNLTGQRFRILEPWQGRQIKNKIILEIDEALAGNDYLLNIEPDSTLIKGRNPEAVLHGIQTLAQLLPFGPHPQQSVKLPCVSIKDSPKASRRIVFIDTARHIIPVQDLKILITWMSYHKLNELHLHLNDDQGWRLEVPRFEKLTKVGSIRASTPPYTNHEDEEDAEEYAGYYSQENIKELVSFASQRHIKIIPGFSLPTHASALLAAYPELGNDDLPEYKPRVQNTWGTFPDTLAPKKETFAFLDELFGEVAKLFPAGEVRIYAPEVPWTQWNRSASAQAFLKENKLSEPVNLRDHFLAKIDTLLAKHERKRFAPGSVPAIDFSTYQRPVELELKEDPTREAKPPLTTIFDAWKFFNEDSAQLVLWTPLVHDEEKFYYQLFPRLAAFAESAWSRTSGGDFQGFLTRMPPVIEMYRNSGINVAEVALRPKREALHGTIVTTDIEHSGDHWPELAFDGNLDSYFESKGDLKKGSHLTFEFAFPIDGRLTLSTGGETAGSLEKGTLESSVDGENWSSPVSFANGLASIDLSKGSRFIRLKVTAPQAGPIVIEELQLSEKLLPPVVKDMRMTQFSLVDEEGNALQAQLIFEADFSDHPGLRDQFRAIRERFFKSTPRFMELANLAGRQHVVAFRVEAGNATSLQDNTLTLDAGELEKLTPRDAENLMLTHLVTYLQNFSEVTPEWFASGMNAYFRMKEIPDSTWAMNLPEKPDRSKALAGDAQSAAFLHWLVTNHSDAVIKEASVSFRKGINNSMIWKGTAGSKTLPELVEEYQE